MKVYLELNNERVIAISSGSTGENSVEFDLEEEHPILGGVFGWFLRKGQLVKDEENWPVPEEPDPPTDAERIAALEAENAALFMANMDVEMNLETAREDLMALDAGYSGLLLDQLMTMGNIEELDTAHSDLVLSNLMAQMELADQKEEVFKLDMLQSEIVRDSLMKDIFIEEQQHNLAEAERVNAFLLLSMIEKEMN